MINNNITKEKLIKELSIYRDYHFSKYTDTLKRNAFSDVIFILNTTEDETK